MTLQDTCAPSALIENINTLGRIIYKGASTLDKGSGPLRMLILYRHVRVHHVDKDKDDPALRDVLSQRPDGPSRGRRRRGGPI